MALGNFTLGSTVRIPLQIIEGGGIPVTDATNVKVQKIIKPDSQADSSFPKDMKIGDSTYGVYYLDYIPQIVGNYIVIFSITIDSIIYTQIENFYISNQQSSGSQQPYAKPVSNGVVMVSS